MRLLLVEDNVKLSEWLEKALRQSGFVVDCLHGGREADTALLTERYDAVILDLSLPGLDGLEVLRRLRHRASQVPVLILTARAGLEDRVRGLNLGADDYLPKPFELSELEARVRALLRRGAGHGTPHIDYGNVQFDTVERSFLLNGQPLALTPREKGVLEVLILKAGRPVSKQTLIANLSSLDDPASGDAVEIYVHRLRKKLEGSNLQIVTLRGLGYLLKKQDAQ